MLLTITYPRTLTHLYFLQLSVLNTIPGTQSTTEAINESGTTSLAALNNEILTNLATMYVKISMTLWEQTI